VGHASAVTYLIDTHDRSRSAVGRLGATDWTVNIDGVAATFERPPSI